MTPEPAAPPPSQRPERDPGGAQRDPGEEAQPGEPQAAERYGPVEIARHVKEDGRALLLYSNAAGRGPA